MHGECPLDCLLGCRGEPDSLSHYAQCPHLYAMQRFFFDGVSEQPLVRFGIQQPCIDQFKIISCTFSAYHALKAQVRCGKIKVESDIIDGPALRLSWSVFAQALSAEAGEMQIPHYAVLLPKFISFLSTGRRGLAQTGVVLDSRCPDVQNPQTALHAAPRSAEGARIGRNIDHCCVVCGRMPSALHPLSSGLVVDTDDLA